MIVPNCHVKRLRTRAYTLATGATVQEVDGIDTASGFMDLSGTVAGNPNRRPLVRALQPAPTKRASGTAQRGNVPNG
jgi:hypothetical protein